MSASGSTQKQQAVAGDWLHLRPRRHEPLLCARRQLVADDAIAFDRKEHAGRVVGGRNRELIVEGERPERPCRKERAAASDRACGAATIAAARAADQGNCTTTSCGSSSRHTVIIASVLLLRGPSNHHRSGFRLAVHAAHRAAAARAVGLLGSLGAGHADRKDPRAEAGRDHSVGRTQERVGSWRAEMRSRRSTSSAVPCSASATGCS